MANAVPVFLDDHVAAGRGARAAVSTTEGTTTYAELLSLVCRTGHALRSLGVESGQRVALLLPDGLAWAAVFFGAMRMGAVAVPLNTRLDAAAWATMLADSDARVLVADPALLRPPAPALGELRRLAQVIVTGGGGAASLEALQARAPSTLPAEPVDGDAMAFWLYTSGTTGGAKAAIHRHRDLLACRHYGIEVLGATQEDRTLATSKLFFAYALGNALLIPLFVGARTFLEPRWPEPDAVARTVTAFRPTLFFSVPTFYARMLRASLSPDTFRSVRACVSAGERLPAEVYEAWRARFGVEILDGLGATETIFMVLSNRPAVSRVGSAGTVVPGTEARLLDAESRPVPDGTPGVLHVRTPSASSGYWNHPEPTRCAFVDGWFRTGDVLTRDADGFYYHQGRADDVFKVAGQWVTPDDVERVLLAHPAVAEAAVVGAVEAGGLVKPFAFVVAKNDTRSDRLADELEALVADRLPPHQRPRHIALVDELPRTATGKLQRFVLRDRVERAFTPGGGHPEGAPRP
jgi:benzoate-CoA ligase family protein